MYVIFLSPRYRVFSVVVVVVWSGRGGAAREWQIRKELFIVDEEQKHVQFAKTFLVGWDNSLSNQQVRILHICVLSVGGGRINRAALCIVFLSNCLII